MIDPRLDVDVYESLLARTGHRLRHILETHRNEDYLVGSLELGSRTGAEIWHADGQLDYEYGRPVDDGMEWGVGRLRLRALSTPGHTPGHMSYVLRERHGGVRAAFSGDTLHGRRGGPHRPYGRRNNGGPHSAALRVGIRAPAASRRRSPAVSRAWRGVGVRRR